MAVANPQKIGMVGTGSMGSGMALLFAEHGCNVFFYDPNEENVDKLMQDAKSIGIDKKIMAKESYKAICQAVKEDGNGIFFFSTPHGNPIDKSIEGMKDHLSKGDILVDCANEHFANTERRQRELDPHGVKYIGCGVSGGYQSARSGPSFSPGGDREALEMITPFLERLAAKDNKDRPCVKPVGPGGSGHYVKMIHNGIEQGMMSVMAEVWSLLSRGLGLNHEEIGKVFRSWNQDGPLHDCFLISIGADIMTTKNDAGDYVLDQIRDKVVQDVDESELTGNWSCEETMSLHVPAATIVSAHMFRYESAFADQRSSSKAASGRTDEMEHINTGSKDEFIKLVHRATYFCFLSCFAEGLDLMRAKDKKENWNLNYSNVLQLWRGGCIIQADGIIDLLDNMYKDPHHNPDTIMANASIDKELNENFSAVKCVVLKAIQADLSVPAMSQSLERYKYTVSTTLPTQFMEAQLDYFGNHKFDTWKESPGKPKTGQHHFEWKPAKGTSDKH
ncbi:hypothetical protein S40285_09411 [Stachybotrys chlorohalonatus IBT 40285]|uniref:6-phosphogluconate dehydrogenase, decarboxylating n=1 Tax=Stachybotrys chlorohalonatus (strain IBT 40285) TaxID=1283841 RepID=A0A084R228_STAC4|nr:hypothetical protein S40285_09411 [Stachybotrys chlorohalonata IBT 40285]